MSFLDFIIKSLRKNKDKRVCIKKRLINNIIKRNKYLLYLLKTFNIRLIKVLLIVLLFTLN
jgi:hypothetical protein